MLLLHTFPANIIRLQVHRLLHITLILPQTQDEFVSSEYLADKGYFILSAEDNVESDEEQIEVEEGQVELNEE